MGVLLFSLPLIAVVAHKSRIVNKQFGVKKMLRVVLGGDSLCTSHVILRMRSELCSLHNRINAIFRQ